MIGKYKTWVHYLNQHNDLISKLDNSSRKTSSLEESFSVANQCVTWKNSLRLQREVAVKVLTKTLRKTHYDSLSSKLNEKEENLIEINVRNFGRQTEQKKT